MAHSYLCTHRPTLCCSFLLPQPCEQCSQFVITMLMCCHLWTSWVVDAQKFIKNSLDSESDVVSYVARYDVYYGPMLSPNAYIARDIVFRYMTLHLLLNILFVAMFGVLSLSMLFLLCAVYLNCFMSDTDTLLSAFLRVMNFCMLFVTMSIPWPRNALASDRIRSCYSTTAVDFARCLKFILTNSYCLVFSLLFVYNVYIWFV